MPTILPVLPVTAALHRSLARGMTASSMSVSRSQVGTAALQQAQLNATDLGAGLAP